MSFLDNIFGTENYGDNQTAFDEYARQMRQQAGNYQPWVDVGRQGLGRSMEEYEKLLNNPNFLQDEVSQGFYESPYQKLMQDMVQQRMNFNAANTGMLGTGAANRAMQDELTAMTGQFQNDYINRGIGSYNQGLGGMGETARLGYGALNDQSGIINEAAGGQLQGAISAQDAKARRMGGLGGLLGKALPFLGGAASLIPGVGPFIGAGMNAFSSMGNGGGGGFGGFGGGFGNAGNGSTFDLGGARYPGGR